MAALYMGDELTGLKKVSPNKAAQFNLELAKRAGIDRQRGKFDTGAHLNGRWTITSKLTGIEGHVILGIRMVQDEQSNAVCALKMLPTRGMRGEYAAREANILRLLDHPNIMKIFDADMPEHRDDTPWIVTEYCKNGTLKQYLQTCNKKNFEPPEEFAWFVFECLVEAVRYCQYGPEKGALEAWDPVSHRDIIPSNIFLTYDGASASVKLAEFGCAVTKFEMKTRNLQLCDLPDEDDDFVPSEGPVASELADVYQNGLVMSCFYTASDSPLEIARMTNFTEQVDVSRYRTYSAGLRVQTGRCLERNPANRMGAHELLSYIQQAHLTQES